MKIVGFGLGLAALLALSGFAVADPVEELVQDRDVVVLGEVHDNPAHHRVQARLAGVIGPSALVFEMLTADQAARITDDLRTDASALKTALDWDNSGWPDFDMYFQIMQAAPNAAIYGAAIPRTAARTAMKTGIEQSFGPEASDYGLDRPLPEDQQIVRLALQQEAHCNALPEDMLPVMVELQRLRDAELARAAKRALDATGGPVVVITGNGHARADWAVPFSLRKLVAGLNVVTIGQSEDGQKPDGAFDAVLDAPAVDRPDPCDAFR
ncbi:ChaN family lipoprotein [Thalassovita sp.]|uniref:ChaN family lipoprotein n=1 Tax=Thalassovita sp. TaxID=1979401 RepID=UPI002B26FF18|nr:ChaN family lipoprotein [Thalassovita sp.]